MELLDKVVETIPVKEEGGLLTEIRKIRSQLFHHYTDTSDNYPWIIAYSGGKDSTTVLHLVIEMMLQLGRGQCSRAVHVVANDTLVESPLVIEHLKTSIEEIQKFAQQTGFPIFTKITSPYLNDSFWFNVIGKGYPPPNSRFRWCTPRMKIEPTTRYIKGQVDMEGYVYMLLGSRYAESSTRSASIKKHSFQGQFFNPHSSLRNCLVGNPIVALTNDDVWHFLLANTPPWGGKTYRPLITLYRNARGGECPTVLSKSDVPSCGTTSPRFGCWTCTVVKKDRSLEGLVDAGFKEFEALVDFRDWLVSIRNNSKRRLPFGRDGTIRKGKNEQNTGPFSMNTRKEILKRLLELQEIIKMEVIRDKEVFLIREQWVEEKERINMVRRYS